MVIGYTAGVFDLFHIGYLNLLKNAKEYAINLFSMKYPEILVPDKLPMPRPVDFYFKDWEGPTRYEFKKNLDMDSFTGNQKWQIYCLERFLNLYDEK